MKKSLYLNSLNHIDDEGKDGVPVAVYLCAEQKLILLFSSKSAAAKYLLEDKRHSRVIDSKIKTKKRLTDSYFKEELALRLANSDQIKTLGVRKVLCLDVRFERKLRLVSAFHGVDCTSEQVNKNKQRNS